MIAQAQLIEAIARSLVSTVPSGWGRIDYRQIELSPTSEFSLRVTRHGEITTSRVPREVVKLAHQLRDVMYVQGSGTWFTFDLAIEAPSSVTSRFNYDDEPQWEAQVPAGAYVTDQHSYPRDVEHQPAWLQEQIATGWARIYDAAPNQRPTWVQSRVDDGTHDLTPSGLVATR